MMTSQKDRAVFVVLSTIIFICLPVFAATQQQSDLLLKEWSVFPYVSGSWTNPGFLSKIPDSLPGTNGKVAPVKIEMTESTINLAEKGYSYKERDLAVFYTKISALKDTTITIGASADWWMKWYANGKKVFETGQGNGSGDYLVTDHTFHFPLTKGDNIIAVEVFSGSNGWRLVTAVVPNMVTPEADAEFTPGPKHNAVLNGPDLEGVFAIVGTFLTIIIAIVAPSYFKYRKVRITHRTIMAMIEKGLPVPSELVNNSSAIGSKIRTDLRKGIINMALGIGFMVFLFTWGPLGSNKAWTLGFIPFLVGTGQLVAWKLEKKESSSPNAMLPPKD